ncbi:uncharacterized protein LOC130452708 [Diorhabda sublineata]|uniref:uncharacterized protein LOC130452708 n=1 Tax=Diorhabda sublineata TaxID=1163346 RepID=UPI0024E17034|nr:uncharacterized protein LOC130452708 [Diorhabda sublineata]
MAEFILTSTLISNYIKNKNSNALRKCFQALVDRKHVKLDISVLSLILKYELLVDLDGLSPDLSSALPYMLVFYIRNWPGWQKSKEYYSGKLNFRDWFTKFREYIMFRLNYLIHHGYAAVLNSITEERKDEFKKKSNNFVDKEVQTELSEATIDIAPFAINIQCPPKMLSSFVFSDVEDDILLSQHQYHPWYPIAIKDLINWPHVAVEFISPELSFKRYNKSQYRRFVNFTDCHTDQDFSPKVEKIEIIDPHTERECYTLSLLIMYAQQFNDLLQKLPKISKTKLDAIKLILEAMLADIYEIGTLLGYKNSDMTIATNTSILFNIGQSSYIRNKKLNRGKPGENRNAREVGYCEMFIPKIDFQMNFFKGTQDNTSPTISFVFLNKIQKMIESNSKDVQESIEPIITFKCLFCDVIYDRYEMLITHFSVCHGMEPNLVCAKCCSAMSLSFLAQARWKHSCQSVTH